MKNKKGSHVGIVLSFVIFVTFLIFLYTIVEPSIKTQKDKETLLDYLKIELMERFSTNLTTATISINRTYYVWECVKLINLTEEIEVDSRLIVKNKLGNISKANISEDKNTDLFIDRENKEEVFFKIYNSEEFGKLNETTINPYTPLKKDEIGWKGQAIGYTVGLVRTDEYIFETKVIKLIEEYQNDSEGLKSELKIPIGSEFSFGLTYSNETRIGTEEKDIPINIYAREIPVQYVDKEANINLGHINIQIW